MFDTEQLVPCVIKVIRMEAVYICIPWIIVLIHYFLLSSSTSPSAEQSSFNVNCKWYITKLFPMETFQLTQHELASVALATETICYLTFYSKHFGKILQYLIHNWTVENNPFAFFLWPWPWVMQWPCRLCSRRTDRGRRIPWRGAASLDGPASWWSASWCTHHCASITCPQLHSETVTTR